MPEINFFWDPLSDNILQERDETGAVTAEYTAEPGLYGNIISQNRGGVESQFHYDAQGSTLAVTNENEHVTDTFAYTAFGEVTERTGTTEVPFQYIGQKGYYTDGLTGQMLVRRRPYHPARGRWLSADPLGAEIVGMNLYWYVKNVPLVYIDPSGTVEIDEEVAVNEGAPCTPNAEVFTIIVRMTPYTWFNHGVIDQCDLAAEPHYAGCPTHVPHRRPDMDDGVRICTEEVKFRFRGTFLHKCRKVGDSWQWFIVRMTGTYNLISKTLKSCGPCRPPEEGEIAPIA